MSGMAEVLAAHAFVDDDACDCNEVFYDTRLTSQQIKVEHSLHLAATLTAAGFGDVWEARAQAWDEGMEAMYATTSSEWPPIPEANPYRERTDHA